VSGLQDGQLYWFRVVAFGAERKLLAASSAIEVSPGSPLSQEMTVFPLRVSSQAHTSDGTLYRRANLSVFLSVSSVR